MAPRPPVDPIFVAATRQMARRGITAAEIVRALQALTATAGKPAPSYSTVLRLAAGARRVDTGADPFVDEILGKLLTGRMPDLYRASLLRALQSPP